MLAVTNIDLAARGETPAAFGRRCIPAGGVAPRSNTSGILGRRALPAGRLAGLGATLAFHHGLLALNAHSTGTRTPRAATPSRRHRCRRRRSRGDRAGRRTSGVFPASRLPVAETL